MSKYAAYEARIKKILGDLPVLGRLFRSKSEEHYERLAAVRIAVYEQADGGK